MAKAAYQAAHAELLENSYMHLAGSCKVTSKHKTMLMTMLMLITMMLPTLQAQVDMAADALWLYGMAFDELQRHIAVEKVSDQRTYLKGQIR